MTRDRVNKMRKETIANNKIQTEGQVNTRLSHCKHCKQEILKGNGFGLIYNGTFGYVHNDKCLSEYSLQTDTSTYKHGIEWTITVHARIETIQSLKLNGFVVTNNVATITINTLNKLKALDNIGTLSLKVNVLCEGGYMDDIQWPNVKYSTMRNKLIKFSKTVQSIDRYGYDKGNWSTFPDFDI